MGVREVQAKSILQKSGLPGIDYVINPYTGCVHGCVYCYARFMKRFTDHPEPWGAFLDAKVNAPDLLARQLSRRRAPLRECVFLSSVTDPYQAPEKKYELTRRLLEVLALYDVPVSILTKSDLVLRDADILGRFSDAEVGMSFGVADDEWSLLLEPRASPPSRRLAALRALRERGIRDVRFRQSVYPGRFRHPPHRGCARRRGGRVRRGGDQHRRRHLGGDPGRDRPARQSRGKGKRPARARSEILARAGNSNPAAGQPGRDGTDRLLSSPGPGKPGMKTVE